MHNNAKIFLNKGGNDMYIPLFIKTDYSLLSSLIKIDNLITYLKKNNITSCAITDDNLFSCMEVVTKCKKNGIKPIIGLEIKINDNSVLLYAKNENGYKTTDSLRAMKFYDALKKRGIAVTLRTKHGEDIDAACGQLRAKHEGRL